MKDISGHILGALLCICFAVFARLTLNHHMDTNDDPVVIEATKDAGQWKAWLSSK